MSRQSLTMLIVLVVLAAACGESPSAEVNRAELISAVDRLNEEPASRFEMTVETRFEPGSDSASDPELEDYAITSRGEIDSESGSSRSTVDLTAALDAAGDGDLPQGVAREIETIAVGDDLFMTGQAFWPLAGDADYVRIDTTALTDGLGFEGLFGSAGSSPSGPTDAFQQLRTLDGFEVVGPDTLEGQDIPTTHVRGNILMGDALDELTPEQRQAMRKLYAIPSLALLRDTVVPVDAFIDDDGRLRRMVQRFDLSTMIEASADGGGFPADQVPEGTVTLTIDLFGFGEDIDIEAPEGAVDLTDELVEQQRAVESGDAPRAASEQPLTHDLNTFNRGEKCFRESDYVEVDCSEPHFVEVLAGDVEVSDGAYPGELTLQRLVEAACLKILAPLDPDGNFVVVTSQPTRSAWEADRTLSVCLAKPATAETTTGSLLDGTAG